MPKMMRRDFGAEPGFRRGSFGRSHRYKPRLSWVVPHLWGKQPAGRRWRAHMKPRFEHKRSLFRNYSHTLGREQ